MNDLIFVGRQAYLFTRPDGTFLVEKPRCCRRIFKETANINTARTFMKNKTLDVASQAWLDDKKEMKAPKKDDEQEKNKLDQYEETLNEIEKIIYSPSFS